MGYLGTAYINNELFYRDTKGGTYVINDLVSSYLCSKGTKLDKTLVEELIHDLEEEAKSSYASKIDNEEVIAFIKRFQKLYDKDVTIFVINNNLILKTKKSERTIEMKSKEAFYVNRLFKAVGVSEWGVDLQINDMNTLNEFIDYAQKHVEGYDERVFLYELKEQRKLIANKKFTITFSSSY
jgi:hypothetical protein